MGSKLTKEEENTAMERIYAQLKQDNDISKAKELGDPQADALIEKYSK